METLAADTSPTLSGRGLKAVLSKARRAGKHNNASTHSFNGTDNSSEGHGLRSSIESVGDKLRVSQRSSIDDGPAASTKSRKLSKLIPKRIAKKVGNPEESKEPRSEEEEVLQGDGRSRNVVVGQSIRSRSRLGQDELPLHDSENEL
jgi:hypothetical protein